MLRTFRFYFFTNTFLLFILVKFCYISSKPSCFQQIVFEGVRGLGFESDMAIDNIMISQGECPDKCNEEGVVSCFDSINSQNQGKILLCVKVL